MNKQLRILTFGSVYLDINGIGFRSEEFLPGNEYVGSEYESVAGGSAVNSAKMMSKLGLSVIFIGKTGDDMFANKIEQDLKDNGVHSKLVKEKNLKTNLGINLATKDGEAVQFVVGNANKNLQETDIMDRLKDNINQIQVVYIGGLYKLKNLGLNFFEEIVDLAHQQNVRISLDHGRIPQDLSEEERRKIRQIVTSLNKNDFYIPSKDEFLELWRLRQIEYPDSLDTPVILKRGDKGSIILSKDKDISVDAFPVNQINTVGAGDTFNATYIYSILTNNKIDKSLKIANAAGAMKVSDKKIDSIEDIEKFMLNEYYGG